MSSKFKSDVSRLAKVDQYRSTASVLEKLKKNDQLIWGLDKTTHLPPWRQKLRDFLSSPAWEGFTFLLIGVDVSLSITSMVINDDDPAHGPIFIVGGFIIVVLVVEMILRMVDLGVRKYLGSCLSVFECVIVVVSAAFFLTEAATGTDPFPGTSIGRAVRPVIRLIKVARSFFSACCARGGLQGRVDRAADRLADQLIEKYLGDILVIPSDNATLTPSTGQFCMQKVQIVADAFQDLHLPFTILGGAVEFFLIDLALSNEGGAFKKADPDEPGLVVAIHNVLLVLGPGHVYPWDFEEVLRCKERLVDLFCRRLDAFMPKQNKDTGGGSADVSAANSKQQSKNFVNNAKQKGHQMMRDILSKGLELDIQNITIRYEDTGKLGPPTVGCFQVPSFLVSMEEISKANLDGHKATAVWRPKGSSTETEGVDGNGASGSSSNNMHKMSPGDMAFTMSLQGLQIFWDVGDKAKPDQAPALAGQRGTMKEFLKAVQLESNWEKARHGVCRAICDGKPHSEGVRARRLREQILQHNYVLFPVNITAHGLFLPSQALGLGAQEYSMEYVSEQKGPLRKSPSKSTGGLVGRFKTKFSKQGSTLAKLGDVELNDPDHWAPMFDINVCIPPIEMGVDPVQLESIQKVAKYSHQWSTENHRFMWQPFAGDHGGIPVDVRWHYALRCVQQRICPNYGWKVSSLLEMRRVSAMRQEYIHVQLDHKRIQEQLKQTSKQKDKLKKQMKEDDKSASELPHERRALELQVFLPLSEILLAQAVVAQTQAIVEDVPKDTKKKGGSEDSISSEDVEALEKDAEIVEDLKKLESVVDDTEVEPAIVQIEGPEVISRRQALQFHVDLDVVRFMLFSAPAAEKPLRSPLMQVELAKLSTTICRSPPLEVQSWRQPAGFVPVMRGLVIEAFVDDARIINQSAPSCMPSMRRFLRRKPAVNNEIRQPLLQVNVGKYPVDGPDELSKLWTTVKVEKLEIDVCRPLLTNLQVHFVGGFVENPGINSFDAQIAVSRKRFVSQLQDKFKSQRDFESASALNSGQLLRAEITVLGLTCNALQPYAGKMWCRERVVLEPCMLKIERGGNPAMLQLGFNVLDEGANSGETTDETQNESPPPNSHAFEAAFRPHAVGLQTLKQWSGVDLLLRDAKMTEAQQSLEKHQDPWFCKGNSDDCKSLCRQPEPDRFLCNAVCKSVCMTGAKEATVGDMPINIESFTPRAVSAVDSLASTTTTALARMGFEQPSENWGIPTTVTVEVLTSEALGLPDPASIPETLNFAGMGHIW